MCSVKRYAALQLKTKLNILTTATKAALWGGFNNNNKKQNKIKQKQKKKTGSSQAQVENSKKLSDTSRARA